MRNSREIKRRCALPLALLGLAAYYAFAFVPLTRKAESLDAPLQKAWLKLAASLEQPNAAGLDFSQISNQLNETRQELASLEGLKKKAANRLELAPELRARFNSTFQLVDFQNERSKQMDD